MLLLTKADQIRQRLEWAMAEEDREVAGISPVSQIVRHELLPSIVDMDPQRLMVIGMRAVIRDTQEWAETNVQDKEQRKVLNAYLLSALVTAGGAEDPLETVRPPEPISHPEA